MEFNWILPPETTPSLHKRCIDLEYGLRPKLTRFLMAHLDNEELDGFSDFHFDVEVVTGKIALSSHTPKDLRDIIAPHFEAEFNTAVY